uniref:Uncharacterized protein n=1 Tax=Setaria italica TaxID=4555 RepID=K3XRH4_SETIT
MRMVSTDYTKANGLLYHMHDMLCIDRARDVASRVAKSFQERGKISCGLLHGHREVGHSLQSS